MKKAILLAGLCIAGSASAAKWDNKSNNNPQLFNIIMKNKINYSFHELPLEAKLKDERLGWSETYWPSNKGGIAYRWNHPNPQPFDYELHTKAQVMKMTQEELGQLSPAELYDISQSDYGYSLTKKLTRGMFPLYKKADLWWEGICHGWSLAAVNYPEPDKNVVTNKEGVKVPFGSSDVKGLLAMHDAFNSKGQYVRVGDICEVYGKVPGEAFPEDGDVPMPSAKDAQVSSCSDVNAGAFHIVLTNMIGRNSQGFIADVDRFNDVWNQPVVSYKSEVVGDIALSPVDMKNGIYRKVQVKTEMTYGDELEFRTHELEAEGILGFVSKEPVTGTPAQTFGLKNYEYVLELDSVGRVVGGEWISITRPDILWTKARDPKFRDGRFDLSGLNSIYKPVAR